jgi:hypothetical protein
VRDLSHVAWPCRSVANAASDRDETSTFCVDGSFAAQRRMRPV